ncbi:WYL domain-containing protein [Paracholeplasma manati]|uniref:WYL domain-containing protein n=1 Tax=Paracholeplasma manati TaxID=591373 RepID=UPI0024077EB3|nr:WYL domain-containing protein [Paracholeplasma manati]MDG0888310.1 hypothetical protein [Paracholeplasma manati]
MKEKDTFTLNEEYRLHINLSTHAMNIIEADMIKFHDDYELTNRSGFMNTIIKNHVDDFPLSRASALKQLKAIERATDNAQKKALNQENFYNKLSKLIIDEFSNEIMKTMIHEYSNKYPNDHQFKLKLNKENASLLLSVEDAKYFNMYAPRNAGISFYIKIILESYAILDREQRERIIFKDTIQILENAIQHHLVVRYKDKDTYIKIEPMAIHKPKIQQSLELIYSEYEDHNGKAIGNITIKELSKRELKGTKEKYEYHDFTGVIQQLFEERETKSNQPDEVFTVKFTSLGLRRFMYEEDRLPIIGIQDPNNEHIYTFKTNETAMFMHLFKFGSQAQILSPVDARRRFKLLYKASFDAYEKLDQKTTV